MSKHKRKVHCPQFRQWQAILGVLGNGWGDGDYPDDYMKKGSKESKQVIRAVTQLYDWLEDRFRCEFDLRPIHCGRKERKR